jgi:hypothetical protein
MQCGMQLGSLVTNSVCGQCYTSTKTPAIKGDMWHEMAGCDTPVVIGWVQGVPLSAICSMSTQEKQGAESLYMTHIKVHHTVDKQAIWPCLESR